MKLVTILAVLVLLGSCSNSKNDTDQSEEVISVMEKERIYKGYSNDGEYLCYLKISHDNRVTFIYETDGNSVYGEHTGTIETINDTTFHVSCVLAFGHYICKGDYDDSLDLFVDPPSLIDMKSILIQYDNDDLMTDRKIDQNVVSFAFNPELFNDDHSAVILTNHIHPITNAPVNIKAYNGIAHEFANGDEVEFDIVISNNQTYSIGKRILQTGHIRLNLQ